MQIQVVSSFVDDPSVTTTFAGLTVPASCLLEDVRTGNRWVLFSGSISEHHWAEARGLGAVGVVRPVPLGYIEQTVFSDRADRRGSMTIDDKLFIPCDELPLVPEKQRPLTSFAPFVHLHAHSEFCLAPETLVCTVDMVWKKISDVVPGETLVGFDEDLRPEEGQRGNSRSKMRPSVVLAAKRRVRDCYRITLEDGTSIISSAKHGWVVTGSTRGSLIEPDGPEGGYGSNTRRWLTTERLGVSLPDRWGHTHPAKLPKLIKWASPWGEVPFSLQREASYLAGIIDGEGWLHEGQLQLAQNPGPVLDEIKRCCEALGYSITADRVQSSKGDCRMFRFAGYETALRVLSQCDPVRFRDRWEEVWVGRRAGGRYSRPVQIVSVEHLGEMETVALTTSTKTFVAEGFLSHNSPLDGLATPQEMVDRAVALDQFAIAVTDHGYCAAHPLLQKAATAAGVKPIFGVEANLVRNRHLREDRYDYWHFLLLARNEVGLRNLWGASSEAHIEGFYGRPRMDFETLARFSEGLIGSTACLRGPLKQLVLAGDEQGAKEMIAKLRAIFPESLYLEIHTNTLPEQIELNKALVQLGKEMSLPLVAVCDAHYAEDCDHHLHKAWIAAQTDKDLSADQDLFSGDEHYYLRSHVEVADSLAYLGHDAAHEAMSNTVEIARSCDVTIKQGSAKPVYHRYVAPGFEGASSGAERDIEVLREKCEAGFALKRLAERDAEMIIERDQLKFANRMEEADRIETYRERLERELAVMIEKGFAGYFLIVEDYCNAARQGRTSANKRLLMGPGRGSVVGSLVAYLLGITQVDPIEADLLFERFITAGRNSPPDIDLDFPSSERPAITEYITHRWGEDRVVRVGTHGRLQNKGVMRSLEKVFRTNAEHAMEWTDLVEITKIIDAAEAHTAGLGLKWDDLWEQEGELLEPYRQKYPQIFDYAERMVKRLKSYGRHASGVVIDPEHPIVDRLPLRTAGDKDDRQVVTEFDMEALELLGYLKFDILTLRTLDTIQVCLDMIEGDEFYGGKLRIDIDSWREEYNDPQVWDMLCSGDTLGVFQIETSSGTRLVKRMQPRSIADLSAILTLVRPGPMRSGLTDTYIKRRFGEEPVVAIHPLLEPVLGRTYQCFGGETEVIVFDGVRRIADLSGGVHKLMSRTGGWVDAEVRHFGRQSLRKVTLRRNKQEKVIWATGDHRWFAKWAGRVGRSFSEVVTDDLRPGMTLQSAIRAKAKTGTNISPVGICAGVVFGDGSATPCSSYVDLWGQKNIDLLPYFGMQRRSDITTDDPRCKLPMVRVFDMPRSWKRLPSLDEGSSYLLGWLAGYFAADGHVDKSGAMVISSSRREHLEHFIAAANIVGIGTYTITQSDRPERVMPQGTMGKPQTQFLLGLAPSTIPEGFLLIEEHRARHEASMSARSKADRTQWSVVSVEATDRVDDVYCAVVPDEHAFVLDGHIVTGNCMIYQEDIMAVCSTLAGYDLEQSDKVRAILGKKKVEEAAKEGVKFIDRAVERGVERPLAEAVWAQMQEFAKYCVSGDTRIMLAGAGKDSNGWMTVEEAHRRLHIDGPSSWRTKFWAKKRGVYAMAVHPDGRIRKCRLLDVRMAGEQETVKITLANGMTITATSNHRHLTPNGLRCIDDGLSLGDELIVNGGYETDQYTPERDRTTVGDRQMDGSVFRSFGSDNYGYINGGFASLARWSAQAPRMCEECGHDGSRHRLERAHLDGDRSNNEWSNLRMLCVSCHKKHDYEHNGRRRRGEKGLLTTTSPIVAIESGGVQMTYDVMVDEPHVWIANGIATTNTFNRAHSWSYAVLAYWCAWLKCHFPAHFAVAVLSTIEKGRIPEFVEMTRRNGYEVLPPDVNESAHGFTVSANRLGVRYGFGSISQIGEATSEAIVQGQPYSSWEDFIERRGSKCNFGHIRTLAGVGTFDALIPEGKTRPALLAMIELLAAGKATTCRWKIEGYDGPNGLPCTFDWSTEVTIGKSGKPLKAKPLPKACTKACRQYSEREGGVPWPELPGLTKKQVRDREREVLGVYLSSTPFDAVPLNVLDDRGIIYGEEFDQAPNGNHGVYAMINSVRLHEDKAGRKMAFVRINSLGYEHDVTVFSTAYQRYGKALVKDTLCIIDLDRNDRGMTMNHIFPIDQEQAAALQPTQEK